MAFPTSPSNNQVHKEGNRAFVYDSTLGTWEQITETDSTPNGLKPEQVAHLKDGQGIALGNNTKFPRGHVIQTWQFPDLDGLVEPIPGSTSDGGFVASYSSAGNTAVEGTLSGVLTGNRILVHLSGQLAHDTGTSGSNHAAAFLAGTSGSGCGASTAGIKLFGEFGRINSSTTDWNEFLFSYTTLTDVVTTGTPTYRMYYKPTSNGAFTTYFTDFRMVCQEISYSILH